MRTEYLSESLMGEFLSERFNNHFENDRVLKDSNIRGRYDYIFYKEKLIVEFDGYRHFNSAKQILSDRKKNEIALRLGFELIRIPYFVQMDSEVIEFYFKEHISNRETFNNYPHGFIDPKAMLPADYCELGQKEFIKFMKNTEGTSFNKSIKNNLNDLIEKNDKEFVVFEELFNLI